MTYELFDYFLDFFRWHTVRCHAPAPTCSSTRGTRPERTRGVGGGEHHVTDLRDCWIQKAEENSNKREGKFSRMVQKECCTDILILKLISAIKILAMYFV